MTLQFAMLYFGGFLYRYRGIIAAPFFILVVIFSRPSTLILLALIFMLTGLVIRIWAAAYIGNVGRGNKFNSEFKITNGPYYLKHPLYLANLCLVLGVLLLFNPPVFLSSLLIILFIIEYAIIIYAENEYLRNLNSRTVSFVINNIKGEISTFIVLIIIFLIYLAKHKFF